MMSEFEARTMQRQSRKIVSALRFEYMMAYRLPSGEPKNGLSLSRLRTFSGDR
jgi:hypothetical protein